MPSSRAPIVLIAGNRGGVWPGPQGQAGHRHVDGGGKHQYPIAEHKNDREPPEQMQGRETQHEDENDAKREEQCGGKHRRDHNTAAVHRRWRISKSIHTTQTLAIPSTTLLKSSTAAAS
ncbi:MAG: hypothetical protein WA970_09900 [Gammaproteobacteria bacterium]